MERKRLSDLGRELFSASIALTSSSSSSNNNNTGTDAAIRTLVQRKSSSNGVVIAKPVSSEVRISRTPTPSQMRNTFYGLESDDEEDEFTGSEEDSEAEPTLPAGIQALHLSPRERASSLHSQGTSPRWEKVGPKRQAPKLVLEPPVVQAVPATAVEAAPFNSAPTVIAAPVAVGSYQEDVSSVTFMEMDAKYKRERNRTQYGKKSNQFKAMKQRMYSMAKRDEQRRADKIRRGILDPDAEDDEW